MKPFIADLLPITGVRWEPLIPLIGPANRSLAHYDGLLQALPNPDVLLSPLTTQEAVVSSRIEGTQATLSDVLKFEAGEEPKAESRRLDVKEILNYRGALRKAETELKGRPFNLNLLLDLHDMLLDSVRGRDKARGRFRTTQNWIGRPGAPIEKAQFVPPSPMAVTHLLDNWEKYYHAEAPDPLVQLALVHAQFEIIHPFLDGNGRLGRILVPLFLYEKNMLSRPMFYLSAYLDEHREEYISRLRALGKTPGSWNAWIVFFLQGLEEQARSNGDTARKILALYKRLRAQVLDLTHSQFAVPLVDHLFEQPVFQSKDVIGRKGMPSKQMLMSMLDKLKKAGILKVLREARGSRAQLLEFSELVNLCEGKKTL